MSLITVIWTLPNKQRCIGHIDSPSDRPWYENTGACKLAFSCNKGEEYLCPGMFRKRVSWPRTPRQLWPKGFQPQNNRWDTTQAGLCECLTEQTHARTHQQWMALTGKGHQDDPALQVEYVWGDLNTSIYRRMVHIKDWRWMDIANSTCDFKTVSPLSFQVQLLSFLATWFILSNSLQTQKVL